MYGNINKAEDGGKSSWRHHKLVQPTDNFPGADQGYFRCQFSKSDHFNTRSNDKAAFAKEVRCF
jgi:hypothetical protein